MNIVKLATAAAIALSSLSVPAVAQDHRGDRDRYEHRDNDRDYQRGDRDRRYDNGRHRGWRNHNRRHRICRWTWRHHHRVRICRYIYRRW